MKKITLLCILTLLLSATTITCSAESTQKETIVEPKASYVFNSTGASINSTAYGGSCQLVNYGSGEMTVILQFLNPVYSGWQTYKGNSCTGTFSNKLAYTTGGYCTLPAGTYRSKTIVTATVNGKTDTRTVYSPELTVY